MEPVSEVAPRRRRGAILVAVLVLAAASAVVARWVLFTTFSDWDDEGYCLLALRAYARGEALYDRIDVIYGPLYFEVWTGISRLIGSPIDNVIGRTFAIFAWVGATLGGFALVLRITRSALAATAAYLLCFPFLVVLRNEPLHPSHSIVLLMPILALAALGCEGSPRSSARWAACGALVAALLLMKVNVGAFALLAFTVAFLRTIPAGIPGVLRRGAALLLLVAAPFLLMRPLFSMPWVRDLALLEVVSLVPFGLMSTARRGTGERVSGTREALAFVSGGILVAGVVIGIVCATGTTLQGMWRVLVVETSKLLANFWLEADLPPRVLLFGAVTLQLIVAAIHRGWLLPARLRETALASLKLLTAAGLMLLYGSGHWALAGLPFVWLLALPLVEDVHSVGARPSTWLIGLLVVAVSLQIYPVAGTQVWLAVFLVPALAVIGFHDALTALRTLGVFRIRASRYRRILVVAAVAIVGLVAHPFYRALPSIWREYAHEKIALNLPGAESLRLTEGKVAVFRWLVANLKHHGATFFGVPGLHSLYGWAQEEPPVPFYASMWVISTPPARQQELAKVIAARRDLCVVRSKRLCDGWLRGKDFADSPIAREVERDFKVAGELWSYELLIPKAKEADLILSAMTIPVPPEIPDEDRARVALLLTIPELPEFPGARLVRFELVEATSGDVLCDSSAASRSERMILADPHGRELLDAPPVVLDTRRDLLVLCPRSISTLGTGKFLVRCYDERGEILARLPLVR